MNHTTPTSKSSILPQLATKKQADRLIRQKQTAMGYVHTQLRNISEHYIPKPDITLRKECESLGFIFNDNKTRDKKSLVKTSLPEGWSIKMPDTSNPRNCFWFRIMDQYGRARYEIFYNANPHRDRHKASIKKLNPYQLHFIHEYPIKNKSGAYLTSEGYRAVVLDSNDNFIESLGFVHCTHRSTFEYARFESDVQNVFEKKYAATFTTPTDDIQRPVSISPNFSSSNVQRLRQLIAAGAVPRPNEEARIECENMGIHFHDDKSFAEVNVFEGAAIYDPMLVIATLPQGWSLVQESNKGIDTNLWFTVRDGRQKPCLHLYFVNAEQTPGLLHATLRII